MKAGQRQRGKGRATTVVCLGLALIILGLPTVAVARGDGATQRHPAPVEARAAAKAKHHSAAWKARERRALRKLIRRTPSKLFTRGFVRRAQASDFRVPFTVRLRPGSQLAVTVLPNRYPLNDTVYPEAPGTQLLDLAGQFTMEIDFSAGPGYGGLGNLQGRTGGKTRIISTSGLRLADFGDCTVPAPDPLPSFVAVPAGKPLVMTSGGSSWSDLNPFSGQADGTLYFNLDLTSTVRRFTAPDTATCGTPGDSADFVLPTAGGLPTSGGLPSGGGTPTDPALPVIRPARTDWAGTFRIAPSITSDGYLRFGKITVDASKVPQPVTTTSLWACAPQAALASPPVPVGLAPCVETSAPLSPAMETVGPAPFSLQLGFQTLNADVIIGDVAPPPGL